MDRNELERKLKEMEEDGIFSYECPLLGDSRNREIGVVEFDYVLGKEWEFMWPEEATEEWFSSNLFISKKLMKKYGLDKRDAVKKIYKQIPKEAFLTLRHIFIIYQQSDMYYVRKYLDKLYPDNEDCDKMKNFGELCDGLVGKTFGEYDCVFINMRNIEKTTKEMYGREDSFFLQEMDAGLWVTLLHEIMHLLIMNPVSNIEEMGFQDEKDEEEEWAENTAIELYEAMSYNDRNLFC